MEVEREKLITLLNYLIEHNGEHSEELVQLVDKAKTIANDAVLDNIREAAGLMSESTEHLKQALMELEKD